MVSLPCISGKNCNIGILWEAVSIVSVKLHMVSCITYVELYLFIAASEAMARS